MPFAWSLNPYMGCAHRCTFCYVRAFELRADRPSGDALRPLDPRQGQRRRGAARASSRRRTWKREASPIGAATDPYQPAEGRYRLTRACLEALRDAANPFHVITREPDDRPRRRRPRGGVACARRSRVNFSIPTLDEDVWRKTEPGTPPPRQRFRALRELVDAGIDAGVASRPCCPGSPTGPSSCAP